MTLEVGVVVEVPGASARSQWLSNFGGALITQEALPLAQRKMAT